jgi:hypothetical protein
MLVFLILSLELYISPNPIEGKVGERIPFSVSILDQEGRIIKGDLSFSIIPSSLGQIQGNFFVAKKEGKGVLKCRSRVNGNYVYGLSYIKIGSKEKARIIPPVSILRKGEQIKFDIYGGEAKEWKCIPANIGDIHNGVFTAKNTGKGRVIALLTNGEIKTALIRVSGVIKDIQISPKFKRLKTGETLQFKIKEEEKVSWSVEGENVGTINSNGLFTAKMPGKAVIKAKSDRTEGQAIVVVSGEVGLRIIPETVTLKSGEKTRFKVNAEGFGNKQIPVNWKVVPERCGTIKKDGTFIAGKVPTKGRVIAVLPGRFGTGIVSADVYIVPDKIKPLELVPSFKHFLPEDIDKGFQFNVFGMQNKSLQWRVIPEDLGSVSNNGVFIPKRLGAGVVLAEMRAEINIKPARAFIVVGKDSYANIPVLDTSRYSATDGEELRSPAYIGFSFPGFQVIEGLTIPLILNKEPEDYIVKWQIIPPSAGRIVSNREFHANLLPENVNHLKVKIFAFLHRGRQIVAWDSKEITIIKAP